MKPAGGGEQWGPKRDFTRKRATNELTLLDFALRQLEAEKSGSEQKNTLNKQRTMDKCRCSLPFVHTNLQHKKKKTTNK